MRTQLAVILTSLLAIGPAGHACRAGERLRPAANDLVLTLPITVEEPFALRAGVARDAEAARRRATRYLELARSTREPRYYGRAEVLLKPWLTQADPPAELLLLQADILQNRHEFPAALQLLDRAITLDPRAPQARLMRVTILMVQGVPARARRDCVALAGVGETALGAVCLAQALAAMGQLERAHSMIELLLSRDELPQPAMRAWALSLLADFASRRANLDAAERYLRAGLRALPQDEFMRCTLSDILMACGAPGEALTWLNLPRPSVGILVRRVLAQTALGDTAAAHATRAQLEERLRLEAQRGERVHLREEALLALGLGKPVQETLRLARANFMVQREPIDVRLLARAAVNARDAGAMEELRDWRSKTGFEDHRVNQLLARSGS